MCREYFRLKSGNLLWFRKASFDRKSALINRSYITWFYHTEFQADIFSYCTPLTQWRVAAHIRTDTTWSAFQREIKLVCNLLFQTVFSGDIQIKSSVINWSEVKCDCHYTIGYIFTHPFWEEQRFSDTCAQSVEARPYN